MGVHSWTGHGLPDGYIHSLSLSQAGSLLDEVNGVIATCAQVRASAALRACLQLVLALGNYLNGTSYRGGAYGFKLADLAKLEQVGARSARDTREMCAR